MTRDTQSLLLEYAHERSGVDRSEIVRQLQSPEWEKCSFLDWRNQVSSELVAMWDALSLETKLVLYIEAQKSLEMAIDALSNLDY
jgi:hypothetical protein